MCGMNDNLESNYPKIEKYVDESIGAMGRGGCLPVMGNVMEV